MVSSKVKDFSSAFKIRICRTDWRAEDGEKSPFMSRCYCMLPLLTCWIYSWVSVEWGFRYLPSGRYHLSSKVHPGNPHTQCLWDFSLPPYLGRFIVEHVNNSPFTVLSFCLFLQAQLLFFYSLFLFVCLFYGYRYFACRCLYITHMQYLHMSGEGISPPGPGLTDSYELLFGCCELNSSGPLKEQHCS